jgi:transposase
MTQERLTVRKIREVLRLKWDAKLSHREIGRACNISCSTVSEYVQRAVRARLNWPLAEGMSDEQLYHLLFPEAARSSAAQKALPEWEQVHRELRKRGVTLKLLWDEYHELFPDGYKYTQYCEYYRQWKSKLSPSMRLLRKGGEELEVDYAGMTIPVHNSETGEITQAQIFVATLAASSYTYAEAQSSQTLANWIGGHVRSFSFFGGLPRLLKLDNLKAGVKSPSYYEPDLNPSYQKMAEYYGIAVLPTRTSRPKDKPVVENGVQNVERWVLAPLRNQTFFSVGEVNRAMRPLLDTLNQRAMAQLKKSRRELFEELDRPSLLPLPEQPYEFALWKTARVNIDYHVSFDLHFYSVPSRLLHEKVEIRATEWTVEIFHQGIQVALHPRSAVPGRFSTQPEHMPANHRFVAEWSPERFLHWAQEIGPVTAQFVQAILFSRRHPEQAYRTCMGLLSLSRKHDHQAMETAARRMLDAHLLTYRDLKAELEALAATASRSAHGPAALPETPPLPTHENIRGKSYYS